MTFEATLPSPVTIILKHFGRLTLPALATSLPADPSTGAMNVSILTPAMQAAVGRDGEPRTTIVERGAIERFAAAIGDDNPAYPDVAPPTFLRSVGLAIPTLPDSEAVPRVLDGGSEWTYGEPVRPGDAITFVTQMETLIEREGRMGSMLIATYVTRYTNQRRRARRHPTQHPHKDAPQHEHATVPGRTPQSARNSQRW